VNISLLLPLTFLMLSAGAMAQEEESDFSQPGKSEAVFEEYGPAHSALQESRENPDEEFRDAAADANDDFSRSVPEPSVAKSKLAGMDSSSPEKRHVSAKKKSHHVTAAKAKKHSNRHVAKKQSKKSRSIASVGKNKKHGKTVAKRGSQKSYLR
jgi:hypothetical protein